MSKITHEQARQHLENKIKDGNILTVLEYIKQQEQTPLIHFDDANHFRNTFYNAPIGTVENEIANKLEKIVGLDNELTRVMIVANNRLERLNGLELEFDKQTKLLVLYKEFFDKLDIQLRNTFDIDYIYPHEFIIGYDIKSEDKELVKLFKQIKELENDK